MKQIKSISIISLALLFVNIAIAQHNTLGELETVNKNGLHEILLPNEIRSFSKSDLSDFRILDAKGKEVPYFIREKRNKIKTSEYVEFERISKTILKDTSSSIVFKNPLKIIQEVVLSTANYSASKTFKLSGSNDLKEWFGVLNKGRLSNLQGLEGLSIDKSITFPRCAYKYLKIEFNDKNSLPINVLKIGSVSNGFINKGLQTVIAQSKTTSELIEKKKTQVHFTFKNREVINQVRFKVVAPEFFNRSVVIYKKLERTIKNKKETYKKQLARFQLNSEEETIFNIPELFESDIFIEINNKDNNALTISDINFFQKPLYVITALKQNENYTIKTGNKTAKAPEYDLSFFKYKISEDLPRVAIKSIVKQEVILEEVKKDSFWQKPWFMWVCIVLTGLIILFFTSSLVKDLKKE